MQAPSEAQTSRYLQLAKVRIHYNEVGEGPPLVCLHGGGPGANSWSNFATNIPAFLRGHRLLLVDLPNFGKSSRLVIEGPPLSFLARVMDEFLGALGIETAAFVGNSYGGQVAIKTAIDFPARVASLVVIGSAPTVFSLFAPMPVEGVKLIGQYYRGEGGPDLRQDETDHQHDGVRSAIRHGGSHSGALRSEHRSGIDPGQHGAPADQTGSDIRAAAGGGSNAGAVGNG